MTCYTEFCTCFKRDDYKGLPGLVQQYSIVSAATAAAAYSAKQGKVSARMARVILQVAQEELDLFYAIWTFDELINGDNHHVEKAMGACDTGLDEVMLGLSHGAIEEAAFQMIRREILTPPGQRQSQEARQNQQQLIEYIGTCPEPEFCRYLHFIDETDAVVVLPEGIILATLERTRRVLNDDRVFFLTLRLAATESAFDQTLTSLERSQEMALRQLQEQGCQIEAVPDANNVFLVHPPQGPSVDDATDWPSAYNPNSGTAWVAEHPRRNHGRRRRR